MTRSLADLSQSHPDDLDVKATQEQNALIEFGRSMLYAGQQSLVGVSQGADRITGNQSAKTFHLIDEPAPANSIIGQNAQMLGSAVGGFVPTVIAAVSAKFAFGKLVTARLATNIGTKEAGLALSPGLMTGARETGLHTGSLGFNIAESSAAGFLYGSVFTPTENNNQRDLQSFLADRATSGAKAMISFGAFTGFSNKMSGPLAQELAKKVGLEKVLTNPVGSKIVFKSVV